MPLRSTASDRGTIRACARAGALALLAASGGGCDSTIGPFHGNTPVLGPCTQSVKSRPVAHIGPDAKIRVPCGASGAAPVASVDEQGSGTTLWSARVQGGPPGVFSFEQGSFQTCRLRGPTVATVAFHAPADALPGDAFDAVALIHADDGSFADGTVNIHAEIVTPGVTVDKTTLDFGDLHPGDTGTQRLNFLGPVNQALYLTPSPPPDPSFSVSQQSNGQGNIVYWNVSFFAWVPGDFSASLGVSTTSEATPACEWTTTIKLHARVLADGIAADGGAEGAAP